MTLFFIFVVLATITSLVTGVSLELVAGNLTIPQSVENVPATLSGLNNITSICFSGDGNLLFIADSGNCKVRFVDPTGIIRTYIGTGQQSDAGIDDGYVSVNFDGVYSVFEYNSDLYVSSGNYFIWKFDRYKLNKVLRIAGATPATRGYGGDGGPAKSAILNQPMGLYVTTTDLLYFADYGNNRIRMIDLEADVITTIAGNGIAVFSGDGGPATSASLSKPTSVWVDNGYLYITDTGNNCIRMIDLSSNIIQTFLSGLNQPTNIVFDSFHSPYYSEPCRIMRYNGTTASLYIGSSSCGVQQGAKRTLDTDAMSAPTGLAFSKKDELFFSEKTIVRKYITPSKSPTFSPSLSPTLSLSPTGSPTLSLSPTGSPTLSLSPTTSAPSRSPTGSPTLSLYPTTSPSLTSKPSTSSPSFRPSMPSVNTTSLTSSRSERLSDISIFYATFFPALLVFLIIIITVCYYGNKVPKEPTVKKVNKYEKVEQAGVDPGTKVVERERFYQLSF